MTDDTTRHRTCATLELAGLFQDILICNPDLSFEDFENKAICDGHAIMAEALGLALERYDARINLSLAQGTHVHDVRKRTLATEVGDVVFSYRRLRNEHGETIIPLADALDLPWGCRVSPGACAFLVEAGAEISYAASARLLARKGGSSVSASTVMRSMRQAGTRCRQDDEAKARDLFDLGIKPDGSIEAEELCVEADGTWIRLQGIDEGESKKMEIKALVAYQGKTAHGKKVFRKRTVRHGCSGSPQDFWCQGIATIGSAYDLSKLKTVHLGADGEGWCKAGGTYLPMRMDVTRHLDPFHVNRAVLSCFADPKDGWHVLEVLLDGNKEEAATLLEISRDMGIAREANTTRVIGYLRNNMDLIGIEGPSLGTMESENQHLYKSRMASVPCAWSRQGASDMARIRSRVRSGRSVPRLTRKESITPRRRKRAEDYELRALTGPSSSVVVQSVGNGYQPLRASIAHTSAEVRHVAGVDSGMIGLPW